jgi:TonB-dependent starch-binding outer membrane protein SusC
MIAMQIKFWHFAKPALRILCACLPFLFVGDARAQVKTEKVTFTGTVLNELGKPIAKASVSTKDRKYGASTDDNGKFSFDVPKAGDWVLVISSVGYYPKEVKTGGTTSFVIRLKENPSDMDAVVVVGYGTKKKTDLSGAVTEVTAELITNQPITSVDQGMAGLLPGVTLREGTGAPGAGPEILIRGINTFGNNKPLVVIDDVIFENGNDQNNNPLALINPEDIQSLVVLKDAASKAIYGSRATAGVILITTKRGKIGKSKIAFSYNLGFANPMGFEKPDILNATELATFRKEVAIDRVRATNPIYANPTVPVPDAALPASAAAFLNPAQYGVGTNWFDAVTRQAITQNSNISVSGGSENVKYFLSINYLNQEGIVLANDLKRYALRGNVDVKITDKLRMGLNFNPSRTESNRSADDPGNSQFSIYGTITSTYWIDPSVPVYQPNGLLNYTTRGALNSNWTANPVYQLTAEKEKRKTTQLLTSAFLEYEPIKNLVFKSSINYGFSQGRSTNFQPFSLVGDGSLTPVFPNADSGRAVLFNNSVNNFINDNTVRYKFKYRRHNVNVMAGFNVQDQTTESSSLNARKITDENFVFPTSSNVSLSSVGNFTGTTGFSKFRFLSLISRLNYSFDDKYLFDFSVRRDGSSRFGRNVQYGVFPAGSFAWRVSEESFMKKLTARWLNELRLEAGYGITGNAGGIGDFGHLGSIAPANYVFGGGYTLGNVIGNLPNPLITWEEGKQLDLGMNASFLNRRISVSFNWYKQITEGALAGIPLSNITGFGSVNGNQPDSKIQNIGFETSVDVVVVRNKKFRWTTNVNASRYKNKLVSYYLPNGFFNGNAGNGTQVAVSRPGEPLGLYRGLRILGVYSAADIADPTVPKYAGAREGGTKYFDGDGNGILDANVERDYVTLGNPHPDLMFGWSNQLQFGNASLRTIFAGQLGGLIYDLRREFMWNVDGNFNVDRQILDRWRPGDDPATKSFGSTSYNTNLYRIPSDNKVYDASYFALKNLTLGYNLAKLLNKKRRLVESAEVSVSVRNVFYISSYKYGNPETRRSNDGSALRGINYGSYPIARNVSIGFNVSF